MKLMSLNTLLAMGAPAGTQQSPQASMISTFGMLAIMMVMFYFVLIRPQQKRTKQLQELLKSIKPGDKVVTGSGIVGVIVTVKEKTVTLRSADSKFEVTKAAITEVTERSGDTSES
jgi:preprotein translocase subunit YajC